MVEMLGGRAGLAVDTGVDQMPLSGVMVARFLSTAAFLTLATALRRISSSSNREELPIRPGWSGKGKQIRHGSKKKDKSDN